MPVIQVDMLAGRDSATKAKLIKELTETYCRITGNPPQSVTIIMRDITHDSWGRAGEPMPPAPMTATRRPAVRRPDSSSA